MKEVSLVLPGPQMRQCGPSLKFCSPEKQAFRGMVAGHGEKMEEERLSVGDSCESGIRRSGIFWRF